MVPRKLKRADVRKNKVSDGRVEKSIKTQNNSKKTATNIKASSAGFLDLPGEIRNEIYIYHLKLPGNHSIPLHVPLSERPSLIRVGGETQREAVSIYYSMNSIITHDVMRFDFSQVIEAMQAILNQCGALVLHFKSIDLRLNQLSHIENLLPLAKFLTETGMTVSSANDGSEGVGWQLRKSNKGLITKVLDSVLSLGKKGFKDGWSEQMVELEFLSMIDETVPAKKR